MPARKLKPWEVRDLPQLGSGEAWTQAGSSDSRLNWGVSREAGKEEAGRQRGSLGEKRQVPVTSTALTSELLNFWNPEGKVSVQGPQGKPGRAGQARGVSRVCKVRPKTCTHFPLGQLLFGQYPSVHLMPSGSGLGAGERRKPQPCSQGLPSPAEARGTPGGPNLSRVTPHGWGILGTAKVGRCCPVLQATS